MAQKYIIKILNLIGRVPTNIVVIGLVETLKNILTTKSDSSKIKLKT